MTSGSADDADRAAWAAALDVYEAALAHHAAVAGRRGVAEKNPWPPAELPTTPVPEEFRERAERLLRESHVVIDAMAGELAGLPTRPIRSQRGRTHRRDTPDAPRWTVTL